MTSKPVFLDLDILKWLNTYGVAAQQHQVKSNGKHEMDTNLSRQFMNGVKFGEIAIKIAQERVNYGEKQVSHPNKLLDILTTLGESERHRHARS